MLQQLVHIIICSFISIIWGIPLLLFFNPLFAREKYWFSNFVSFISFLFFLGCIVLGTISAWLSFFIPLDYRYLIIITIILCCYLLFFHKKNIYTNLNSLNFGNLRISNVHLTALIASLLLFLYLSSLQPVL